ncbi:MAG: hypothetical protein P8184_10760 [Calditrichia bacterium]
MTPKAEAMQANKHTAFFKDYREEGVPPTQVPAGVADPLGEKVMSAPEEMIINRSDVFDTDHRDPAHSFNSFVCEECGEMTVTEYGRLKGDSKVCMDCAKK